MYMLPESLTVFNSEEILDSLNQYIQNYTYEQNQSEKLVVDATNLVDLDGAGLQILLATQKTCQQRNITFVIIHMNEEISELLKMTGAKNVLEGAAVSE